ncbi:serine racemase [Angomonas deanei]|nr:serine racemase [Angomonas deanei]|eukprot:EPY43202.1 serine racemase [Angomonas deanei]
MADMSLNDIIAASNSLRGYINKTPVIESVSLRTKTNKQRVYLKCENLQRTGTYHIRGMLYKVIKLKEEDLAVNNFIIHSAGNSGAALSLAANLYQGKAHVVVPKSINSNILKSITHYKGQYYECEPTSEARNEKIKQLFNELNYSKDKINNTFRVCSIVKPYRDRTLMIGYATLGLEFLYQTELKVDCIIVPVAGGLLLAGVALAVKKLKPNCAVYGADVVKNDKIDYHGGFYKTEDKKQETDLDSFKNDVTTNAYNKPGATTVKDIVKRPRVADSIVSPISPVASEYINAYVDGILHVDELQLKKGFRYSYERLKLVVDIHAATAVAALIEYADGNNNSAINNKPNPNNNVMNRNNLP